MPGDPRVAHPIDPSELVDLERRYGKPLRRAFTIETDPYVRAYRGRKDPDRRGEVVFAIRQPSGEILLHKKHRYELPIYRLPTGGIQCCESVEEALFREVAEETGQDVVLRRFLGLLDCRFVSPRSSVHFASYVFYLESLSEELRPTDLVEVAGFRTVPVGDLGAVARSLRNLNHARRCWGYWRSLAHDLVGEALASSPGL